MVVRTISQKWTRVGALVLLGTLVFGAVAAWVLPTDAEARHGSRTGYAQGERQSVAMGRQAAPNKTDAGHDNQALNQAEEEALLMAIDDEYKAWSIYEQVIDDFGGVRPFTSIQRAEENHIAALERLLQRYGMDVPANEWEGNVPSFDTLTEACAASAQAEIDNAELYDELFEMVDNVRVIRVFEALQRASESRHLPAFENCAP